MKKLFTFIVGAFVGLGAYSQNFDSGDLRYTVLDPDARTCSVSGYNYVGTDLVIPEMVQDSEGEWFTVTEVSPWSLSSLGDLQNLTLPSTLEVIKSGAFYNCWNIKSLVIPNSVKVIESSSFAYCYEMKNLELGSSVELVESHAFYNTPLNVLVAKGTTPAKCESSFSDVFSSNPLVAVSDDLIAEYQNAWSGANVVANIDAESLAFEPDHYTVYPGKSVQLNCVVYPENAPIKYSSGNSDIITVDNNGLVTADKLRGGYGVWVTATSLNGLQAECYVVTENMTEFSAEGYRFAIIPDTENEVAIMSYESGAPVVNIPETVEYDGNIYYVTTIGPNVFDWNSPIEEVEIPASVKIIREENFRDCQSLKKVTIADSETTLQLSGYNFTSCGSLSDVYVGRNLTYTTDKYVFRWNDSFSALVLGPQVTELPDNIFSECYYLSLVQSKNPVPPVLGNDVFSWNSFSIIVPAESVEAYKEAWGQYANYISEAVDATAIYFDTDELTIYSGQNVKLNLTVEPEGASVFFTSSNSNLISVDKEGNINYNSGTSETGEAIITASTINGLTAECKVTANHWLTFSGDKVGLTPGSTYQVEVTKPDVLADQTVTWTSGNEDVATVGENGLITAVAYGDTDIFAEVYVPEMDRSFSYSIPVEVYAEPTSVTVEQTEISVMEGGETQILYTIEPQDEPSVSREMTWTVADPEIAEVFTYSSTEYGIRGLKPGVTTITGETVNGLTVELNVTVKAPVQGFNFATDRMYLGVDQSKQMEFTTIPEVTYQTFSYVSENEEVATVDADGVVTGHSIGNTEIRIIGDTSWGPGTLTWYPVEVVVLPENVSFAGSSDIEGQINSWNNIPLEFTPDTEDVCRHIDWTVDDPEIVEMYSWANAFNGLKFGTTGIHGVAVNGDVLEGTITIAGIQFTVDGEPVGNMNVNLGDQFQVGVNVYPEDIRTNLEFYSGDPNIITVSEDGTVTAVGYGRAWVNAQSWIETADGERKNYYGSFEVAVSPSEGIALSKEQVVLSPNNRWINISLVSAPDVELGEVVWSSSDESVVEIGWHYSLEAEIRYAGPGTATVTATDQNGNVAQCEVTCYGIRLIVNGESVNNVDAVPGEQFKIDVNAYPEELLSNITYESYNSSVATVDEDGNVTAEAYGSANIHVSSWYDNENSERVESYTDLEVVVRPASGIAFEKEQVVIMEGWTYITLLSASGLETGEISWASSDESVVVISWSDNYRAELSYVGPGHATVTATDQNGNVASCEVTCIANIDDFTFNTNKIYVAPGETFQLEYTTVPEWTGQTIRFESDNESVATVDPETGLVTGVDYGSTDIYAVADNGGRWSVPVLVCNLPESVQLVGSTDYEGTINEWTYLEIEYTPNDDVCREIQWTAYDPEIGYFDSYNNAFYGVKLGTTGFRGVAANGDVLEGTITINGIMAVVDGEETSSVEVSLGSEIALDVAASSEELREHLTYESENPEVATVDDDGTVTAVGPGRTNIIITSTVIGRNRESMNYQACIEITVKPTEGIVFDTNKLSLSYDETLSLSIIRADGADVSEVHWNSSDVKVVAITWSNDYEAQLSYVGPGTAIVTATYDNDDNDYDSDDDNSAKCEVTCYGIGLSVNGELVSNVDAVPGEQFKIDVNANPAELLSNITYESYNSSVATVDEEGYVTAEAYGTTYIHVSSWYDNENNERVDSYIDLKVTVRPASGIAFNKNEIIMVPGETSYISLLHALGEDPGEISWESSDDSVVSISGYDNDGADLKYVGPGHATVIASPYNGEPITCEVICVGLSLNETYIRMGLDQTRQLEVLGIPAGLDVNVDWWSENSDVVNVTDGLITPQNCGSTRIYANVSTSDGRWIGQFEAYVEVIDWVYVTDITLNPSNIKIKENMVGKTVQIEATVEPWNATDRTLTWYSSDESVATVDQNGLVTIVSRGSAVITVSTTDGSGVTATCELSKAQDPVNVKSIELSKAEWEGFVGESITLQATLTPSYSSDKRVIWTTSDESVATVDRDGRVTAIAAGNAVITATAHDNSDISAECKVTVKDPVLIKSLTITPEEWSGEKGGTFTITATILPEDATFKTVKFESSDTNVATVDSYGQVTVLSEGSCVITVSTTDGSGITAECKVTVNPPAPVLAESLTITPTEWSGEEGESFRIEATVLPEDTADKTLSFVSSNTSVATVDSEGQVTLVSAGTCVISVSTTDGSGLTAECQVTVNAPAPVLATSLTISPTEWSGEEGESFRIEATVLPEDTADKTLSFVSSNTSVATVDNEGLVTLVSEGTCVITVSTTDGSGLTAECSITGVSGIEAILAGSDSNIDVYTQQGILIKHNCTVEDLKMLQSGIYIVRRGNIVKTVFLRK